MLEKPLDTLALVGACLVAMVLAGPAWAQSSSQSLSQGLSQGQTLSEPQIRRFCKAYAQMPAGQRKPYQDQYERYCDRDQQPQQPSQRDEPAPGRQPQAEPEEPEPGVEPEITPSKPEPVIPEPEPEPVIPKPEPLRVDLAGELRLEGEPARRAGQRQRFRIRVANRGEDAPPGGRLWARVFLSERNLARRRGSPQQAAAAARHGRPVRLPSVPAPGQERDVTGQMPLPPTVAPGHYVWCVWLDSRDALEETDETNNLACSRTTVALGDDASPEADDSELSGLFGAKVDQLAAATEPNVETWLAALPEHIRPAVERMNTLRVNGALDPDPVAADGAADVAWSDTLEGLPAAEQPDGLWLLVGDASLGPMDCLGDLASRFGGHPDAGLKAIDGAPVALSLDSEHYEVGTEYHLLGCYWADGAYSGDWTNEVAIFYGEPPGLEELIDAGLITTAIGHRPDLVVSDVHLLRGGDKRGALVIPFRDRNADADRKPPAGTFHYWVYVLPTTVAAKLSSLDEVARHPEIIGSDTGIGRIREGATGGIILTDPVVPAGASRVEEVVTTTDRTATRHYSHTVFVAINRSPFGPYAIEGEHDYPEAVYDNNYYIKEFFQPGAWHAADNVLDMHVTEFHGNWARLSVRYNLVSETQGNMVVLIDAEDGESGGVWSCSSGRFPGALIRAGVNEEVEFVCALEEGAGPVRSASMTAALVLDGPVAPFDVVERAFPLDRRWGDAGPLPAEARRPDLSAAVLSGPSLYWSDDGAIRVGLTNTGYTGGDFPFRIEKSTRWFSNRDCRWRDSGRSLSQPQYTRSRDVSAALRRDGAASVEREIDLGPAGPSSCDKFLDQISPYAERAEVRITVMADPDDDIDEVYEHNNSDVTLVKSCEADDTPGLKGSGGLSIRARRTLWVLGIPNRATETRVDRGGLSDTRCD